MSEKGMPLAQRTQVWPWSLERYRPAPVLANTTRSLPGSTARLWVSAPRPRATAALEAGGPPRPRPPRAGSGEHAAVLAIAPDADQHPPRGRVERHARHEPLREPRVGREPGLAKVPAAQHPRAVAAEEDGAA